MVKGVAQGLKIDPNHVSSPTFVLMNIYKGKVPLYHFDLYRITDNLGLSTIGYDDYLYGDGIAVIEWAERFQELLPKAYLAVCIKHKSKNVRSLRIQAVGEAYQKVLPPLKKKLQKLKKG